MSKTDWLLVGLGVLALARIVQAWAYHRAQHDQADIGFSLIVDYLEAIKERLQDD